MKLDLVEVLWNDAWGSSGWMVDPPDGSLKVRSIGWLFRKNKIGVTLIGAYSASGTPSQIQFIPMKMVHKVITLRRKMNV